MALEDFFLTTTTSSSLEAGSGFVVISGSPLVAGGGSSGGVVAAGGSSEGVVAAGGSSEGVVAVGGSSEGVVTAGGSSEGVEPEWWITSSAEVGTGLDNTGRGEVSPWEVVRCEESWRVETYEEWPSSGRQRRNPLHRYFAARLWMEWLLWGPARRSEESLC